MFNGYRLQPVVPAQRPDIFSIMVEPRAAGPVIGIYHDRPIAARVIDQFGRRFTYAGVIGRRRDGQYDVDRLTSGQFIVEPGIVYDLETKKKQAPEKPAAIEEGPPAPIPPREDRRVFAQIAGTLALFLSGSLAIHLLLMVFQAG
jgi:hypothetical protein